MGRVRSRAPTTMEAREAGATPESQRKLANELRSQLLNGKDFATMARLFPVRFLGSIAFAAIVASVGSDQSNLFVAVGIITIQRTSMP